MVSADVVSLFATTSAATTSAAPAVSLAGEDGPSLQYQSIKCNWSRPLPHIALDPENRQLSMSLRLHPIQLTTVVTDTNVPPPALIEMLSHCTRMIRRIPRGARSSVASKLACLIECILAFPKAVLCVPTQTSEANENQSLPSP
ncbi:hypothetical protein ACOME3_007735 [Neoechinorhynchus agilis]